MVLSLTDSPIEMKSGTRVLRPVSISASFWTLVTVPCRMPGAVGEYVAHYNTERHHQGIDGVPLPGEPALRLGRVRRHERLGGLLSHYHRRAA